MKTISLISTLFIILLFSNLAFAQITEAQQQQAQKAMKTLVAAYVQNTAYTENVQTKLNTLFEDEPSDVELPNDILPTDEKMLSLAEYKSASEQNYQSGLKTKLSGEIIVFQALKKGSKYVIQARFKKAVFGIYKQTQIFDHEFDLMITSYFNIAGNEISTLKISEIIFFNPSKLIVKQNAPQLQFGLVAYSGTAEIAQEFDNQLNNDFSFSSGKLNAFGFEAVYNFSKRSGITTGAFFGKATSSFSIPDFSNWGESNAEVRDVDGDNYFLWMQTNGMSEETEYSFIQIPVNYRFTINPKERGLSFYLNLGSSILLVSSTHQLSGSNTFAGFYEQYNVLLEDIPEYGFQTLELNETSEKNNITVLAANAGLGAQYLFGSFSIAVESYITKTGGPYSSNYDKYSNPNTNFIFKSESSNLTFMGAKISLLYKLK